MGQLLSTIFGWWRDAIGEKKKLTTGQLPLPSPITNSQQSLSSCSNFKSDDAKLKIKIVGNEKKVSARPQLYNTVEETEERTSEVVGRNWTDCRSYEGEEDLEEGKEKEKIFIGVRRIKHYRSDYKILLVGEGDFSFSASLALAFASATNITATSLDSIGK